MLFGLFPVGALVQSVWDDAEQTVEQAQQWLAAHGVQITSTTSGDSVTVQLSMNATPPAGATNFSYTLPSLGILTATLSAATVAFASTVTRTQTDLTAGLTTAMCSLGQPAVALVLDGNTGVTITFTELTFTSASNAKPSFKTDFGGFAFTGDLTFLNLIMAVLPSSLFSNPPQLTIDDTHAEVACNVGLPAFGFGVFDFKNVNLNADAIIRFDPSQATDDPTGSHAPLEFDFSFGTLESPFSCAISLLEGQGSFEMTVTTAGLTIDCSIAFGGAFEIDLVIVSGGVSQTAGLHLTKTPSDFDVGGFVHISGGVEVLDIVGVTLDALLALIYDIDHRVFTSTVSVTIGISVLFFHQDVSFSITKSFSLDSPLGSNDGVAMLAVSDDLSSPFAPRPSPVSAFADVWNDYCKGFAA